ncbi:MAG: hypothetical protein IPG33_17465 [Betaproteobacteria bacterium]|nr:hypothetical protein [Betaproteobacteria bacterium]
MKSCNKDAGAKELRGDTRKEIHEGASRPR